MSTASDRARRKLPSRSKTDYYTSRISISAKNKYSPHAIVSFKLFFFRCFPTSADECLFSFVQTSRRSLFVFPVHCKPDFAFPALSLSIH